MQEGSKLTDLGIMFDQVRLLSISYMLPFELSFACQGLYLCVFSVLLEPVA